MEAAISCRDQFFGSTGTRTVNLRGSSELLWLVEGVPPHDLEHLGFPRDTATE